MTSRREFLQHATTVVIPLAAAPLASGLPGMASAQFGAADYHAVLIDDRHAEARLFGYVLAARGAAMHTVPEGDVTSLWLSNIRPAWQRGPVAIAGLTRPPALFCLEQLAWAQGLRVVFHEEHVVTPALTAQVAWPVRMADIVSGHRGMPARHVGPTSAGLAPSPTQDAQLLTSWIIAAA